MIKVKMKFKSGDKVVLKTNFSKKGEVLKYNKHYQNVLSVEWNDGTVSNADENALVLEEELPKLEKEFEEEKQKFEARMMCIERNINQKLKEAAEALNEANALAKTCGISISDGYCKENNHKYYFEFNISPFRDAIDKAGWSSSSMSC